MNWTEYVAAIGAVSAAAGGMIGAVGKSWLDSKMADRKDNLDQLQLALAQIQRQDAKIEIMGAQITNLGKRIESLLVENVRITLENKGLRIDVTTLQNQLKSLGHQPAFAEDVATYCCDPACPLAQSKAKAMSVAKNVQGDKP